MLLLLHRRVHSSDCRGCHRIVDLVQRLVALHVLVMVMLGRYNLVIWIRSGGHCSRGQSRRSRVVILAAVIVVFVIVVMSVVAVIAAVVVVAVWLRG